MNAIRHKAIWDCAAEMPKPVLRGQVEHGPSLDKVSKSEEKDTPSVVTGEGDKGKC